MKKMVVVIGMHRTGTSVLTRSLSVVGVELGDNLMIAGSDNLRGYWEDLDIYALNDEMLKFLHIDWHSLMPICAEDVDSLCRNGYLVRAVELLRMKTHDVSAFGFKDPRVAKLLPFWKQVLSQGKFEVHYLLSMRHPLSVCESLAVRDAFNYTKSYFLWLEHVLNSLDFTQEESRILVDYDLLMQAPDNEIRRISSWINLPVIPDELEKFKQDFIDNTLRHSVYSVEDIPLEGEPPFLVREIFFHLSRVSKGEIQLDTIEFQQKLAYWMQEFDKFRPMLGYVDIIERSAMEQSRKVVEQNQVLAERNIQLAERDVQLTERDVQLTERDVQLTERNTKLMEMRASKAWRFAMFLRRLYQYMVPPDSWRAWLMSKIYTFFALLFRTRKVAQLRKHVEMIKASGYFDREWYLAHYVDVARSSLDPLDHYLLLGGFEDRDPGPRFSSSQYLKAYSDVRQTGINPLLHYLQFGIHENRNRGIKKQPQLIVQSRRPNYLQYLSFKKVLKGWHYLRLYGLKPFLKKLAGLFSNKQFYLGAVPFSEKNADLAGLLLSEPSIPRLVVDKPVDILIPVYNGLEYLEPLFTSLVKNTAIPYRLLIANDKSPDERVGAYLAAFKSMHPELDITVLENEKNQGFVRTVNALASLTHNHFVILNTDIELPPNWLERLMFPIFTRERIASVTPFTNAGTICSFPKFVEDNPIFGGLQVDALDAFFKYVKFTEIEIPTAVGFCMAINKQLYDEIGMFDEAFGKGYGEENDWCMRAFARGYKNIIAPNLFVYHKHGGSFDSQEKLSLMNRNAEILRIKHPHYFGMVEEFIHADPLSNLRNIIQMKILSSMGESCIVFTHSFGGGAEEYLGTQWSAVGLSATFRYRNSDGVFEMTLRQGEEEFIYTFSGLDQVNQAVDFFISLGVREMVINNIVGYPAPLEFLDLLTRIQDSAPGVRLVFLIHDFYCICPMQHLLSYKMAYCGVPDELSECETCLVSNSFVNLPSLQSSAYPIVGMSLWRQKFGAILHRSSIICFSSSSREILRKAYPGLQDSNIQIIPHQVNWVRPVHVTSHPGLVNIAIIGGMAFHKGVHVVAALANYLDDNNINARIHIFGEIHHAEAFHSTKNVVPHGKYLKTDLPVLMEQNCIDVVLIPSIIPETFSYATQEAIEMKLPVAVFDIGAPAERVRAYDKGIVLVDFSPANIFGAIQSFLKKPLPKSLS